MHIYKLHKETLLPISIQAAWDFFSHPVNLDKITPPDVKFKTITELGNARIETGMRIKYTLRPLLNIPIGWETEIREVSAPFKFMDKQMKGPYALWEHTHTFYEVAGGVRMIDDVRYALPMGMLGKLAHSLFVKKQLDGIFNFREKTIADLFGTFKKS